MMSARIIKLLALILAVAAIVSYVFYLNPQPVAVTLARGSTIEKPLAVILICVFCVGTLFASFFWMLLGIQYKLRDRQVQRERLAMQQQRQQLLDARGLIASGDYVGARRQLDRLLKDSPDDILARISYAESFRREGKLREALAVLDNSRLQSKNPEVLLLASELNSELGNPTAAYDNMALLIADAPRSAVALDRLVSTATAADRLEEAFELQRKLIRHPGEISAELHTARQNRLARIEVLLAKKRFAGDSAQLRQALEDVLRRHREFDGALYELGMLAREAVQLDEATKQFSRAFHSQPNVLYLEAIARTWLAVDDPGRAVTRVRALAYAKISPSEAAIAARVFLISLLLALENIEEAVAERRLLEAVFGVQTKTRPDVVLLDALILRKGQEPEEAFDMLFQALVNREQFQHVALFRPVLPGEAASPSKSWEQRARSELLASEAPPPRLLGN